jgi:hypothetical protein
LKLRPVFSAVLPDDPQLIKNNKQRYMFHCMALNQNHEKKSSIYQSEDNRQVAHRR